MRMRFPMEESMARALQSVDRMRTELDKLAQEYKELQVNQKILREQFHDAQVENAALRPRL
jgi:regulator of replication initiation timing